MQQRTKIVATLGPSSSDPKTLERMILAGVDVVRLNFSHGTAQDHIDRAEMVREISNRLGRTVGIMSDLQGPKIRIGKFEHKKIKLKRGDIFTLDAECELGNEERVGLDYKDLIRDVSPGDILLLDDGRIVLVANSVTGNSIVTSVRHGGYLSNNKGINRQGGGLSAPALTAKDMEDIKTAARFKTDYIAVSFPRSGDDIRLARKLMTEAGGNAHIIAKIERAEAIPALDEILEASDGIMVARGDLGVEVGDAAVPALQKKMIKRALKMNKLTITATQMMESMIENPIPTRAEVSDVANAVIDGTDAVMLSAETAAGKYPVETIEAMSRICIEAEKSVVASLGGDFLTRNYTRIDQSIALAAVFTAFHLKVKAVASLTQTGSTPLCMSRTDNGVPIYALTNSEEARRKMSLYRGVYPIIWESSGYDRDKILEMAEVALQQHGAAEKDDFIVLTIGEPIGEAGGTNTMKIVKVGEHRN